MRFRLLSENQRQPNSYTAAQGMWKPYGGVKDADSHEEALRQVGATAGRWLVLCEEDHTWRIFTVSKRTETDIEPADINSAALSSALRGAV